MINLHYAHECPNIPELCSLTFYNSRIILKIMPAHYIIRLIPSVCMIVCIYDCMYVLVLF